MSIEVKLTGEDATKYLEQHTPDTSTLATALQTATEYIDMLEKKVKGYEDQFKPIEADDLVSSKVLKDTAIVKELKPSLEMANTKWTKGELGIIYWAMDRPEDELNRRADNIFKKITRTEGAIRAKLNDLNIEVIDGVMYYMKD